MVSFNRDNTSGCPCKECEDRHPACHDNCEKFRQWRKKVDSKRENERSFHQRMDTMSDAKKRELWRQKRYQRRRKNQNNLRSE